MIWALRQFFALGCWAVLVSALLIRAAAAGVNPWTHLDDPVNPYYVDRASARLTTPQWLGDPGVDAVIVLAIDDMRDPQKYETFLRPILDRLRQIEGRAPLSIMTNQVDPHSPQLQTWIKEGVSIEVHTTNHPCPLLCDNDFAKAKSTYDECVDLMNDIPDNSPVAFRMPCCDSLNTVSPRFFADVFAATTPGGHFLTLDSSVFNVTDSRDPDLPPALVKDSAGRDRFQKYLPFPSFVNTIRNYPYPYVIGNRCWEFPCVVPSDWEGNNLHQPNNPQTVEDLRAAVDVTVLKQGVMNFVFHPHGWIRSEQVIEVIDHAVTKHPGRVKFLSFADAQRRLNEQVLGGQSLRGDAGQDNGFRLIDLNGDGHLDVVRYQANQALQTRVWNPQQRAWQLTSGPVLSSPPHFGNLDGSARVSLLAATPTSWQCHVFATAGAWQPLPFVIQTEGLSAEWQQRLQAPAQIPALRIRDIDGDQIGEILLGSASSSLILRRQATAWQAAAHALPPQVVVTRDDGQDAGLRWVDLNGDGREECLFSNDRRCGVYEWMDWQHAWRTLREYDRSTAPADARLIPAFVRPDGTNNGVWAHSQHLWWQNEDTARLPDKVDRLAFADLLPAPVAPVSDDAAAFPGPVEPADAIATFRSSVGASVELVAAEPMVVDPVAFDWSADGRLWVVEMRDYPVDPDQGTPTRGRVKILTDTDHDGQFDRADVYLDGLEYPTGIKVWRDGCLVTAAPKLLFAPDRDHDGRADEVREICAGFTEGNQQHRFNGLCWGLDGWLYLANGGSGGDVQSFSQAESVDLNGRDLRVDADTGALEALTGFAQFGRARNDWGDWFGCDNSNPLYHYVLDDHYLRRNKHYAPPFLNHDVPAFPGPAPIFPASRTLPRFNDFDRADRFTSACSCLIAPNDEGMLFGPVGTQDTYVCEPVHNLIHRERMVPQGISFRSDRLPEEQSAEFLASTDNWFRPVMVRVGPDGALWIADMYRLVIEHPEWIPRRWQEQLNIRAGNDRGRIYRVTSAQAAQRHPLPRLNELSLTELVERLGHANRWQRDTAQQLLIWRNDGAAIGPLRDFCLKSSSTPGRIQALYTLQRLHGLDEALLVRMIEQSDAPIARHAIALSESRLDESPALIDAMWRLSHRDQLPLAIRQQLAYSWGESRDERAAHALAHIAVRSDEEPAVVAAAMSSLQSANIDTMLLDVSHAAQEPSHRSLLAEIIVQAVSQGSPLTHGHAAEILTDSALPWPITWRLTTLQAFLDAYQHSGRSLEQLPSDTRERFGEWSFIARNLALDAEADASEREAALSLLRGDTGDAAANRETLVALADPRQPPDLQRAAVDGLLAQFGDTAVSALLAQWDGFSPRIRGQILERAWHQKTLTVRLLTEAADRQLELPLDARRRQQLLSDDDPSVRELAARVLAGTDHSSRAEVVGRYQSLNPAAGDAAAGQQTFLRVCSTCHHIGEIGHAVGPDLTALSNKSTDFLLTAILDPNQAVEAHFMDYLVQTTDGRQLSGLLLAETANSIRLLAPDAKEHAVLREDIESIKATGKSLMPEGLEKDLTPTQLQDLLHYLQSFAPRRKTFPGNRPGVVEVRDDGSIRLLAMNAEIYGPTLVYEDRFRNLGFWGDLQDYAAWTLDVPTAGDYRVTLEYACPDESAGNRFAVVCETQQVTGEIRATGTWNDYGWQHAGTIKLPAGKTRIILRPDGVLQNYLMDLHQVIFEKAD